MVDCGNLRCFQEKRSIKKELLSWSKKVTLAVGLEAVAEQVGSRRKVRKLFEPFNCLENADPQDWEPEENCFYCKDRLQLLFDAIEKTDSKGGGKILKDHPSLRHLGEVLPFCPQFYTSNFGRDILSDIKAGQNEVEAPPPPTPPSPPKREPTPPPPKQPGIELKIPHLLAASKQKKDLATADKKGYSDNDLSAAVMDIVNGKLGTRRAASLYGIPRSTLRNKLSKLDPDGLCVSTMLTEDEDASSNDSQPTMSQQTVPNTQSSSELHEHLRTPLKQLETTLQQQSIANTQPLLLSDLLHYSTLQYLAPYALPYIIQADMMPYYHDTEWEKKLQHIRHKHNLQGSPTNVYQEKAHDHKLKPYQYELIKKLTRERLQMERNGMASHQLYDEDSKQSLLHSLALKSLEHNTPLSTMHCMPQVDHSSYEAHSAILKALNGDPLMTYGSKNASDTLPSKLNIPAYNGKDKITEEDLPAPARSKLDKGPYDGLFKYENTRIGDTLKDIIVKTISEKVRCKLESTDFSHLVGSNSELEKQKAKETILSAFTLPDTGSPPKKIKREPGTPENTKSASRNSDSNSSSTQTKKTRPKRGQYRKYNSQLLTEAVKAVQRGEMSVHRAGSYYGVPHSTLEYKVKERHLLRQKKIKEQQEQKMKEAEEAKKNGEPVSAEPSPSKKTRVSPTKSTPEALNISSPKTFPGPSWLPPYVGPSPFDSAAALGLFGSGFGLSTPASELLRKLQHKVQS